MALSELLQSIQIRLAVPLAFLKGAKDMGSVVMDGKHSKSTSLTMELGLFIWSCLTCYEDQSNPKESVPIEEVDQLISFNGPEISEGHTVYNGFKAGET